MLFNSIGFAIFLPIVFSFYWLIGKNNLRLQNILLLVSSYFFYACWDYRFMFLLMFSTLLDYYTGIRMGDAENKRQRKFWLWLSIGINLGFLGIFKYYNFFAASAAEALTQVGIQSNFWSLNVILPIGISFYTFHGLSYVLDIYNEKIKPERDFIDYGLFVSFFPLLVAGPIERATHLLPQIVKPRTFDANKAIDGLRQILWGLFKKIVIADNCATYVNLIFNNSTDYSGSTLFLGSVFFAFQIYCDFSGYSDIALGTARLFGIELLRNFAFPYFSRDIAEFWRRWHISLSSWFRDYLYIPLGGSKGGIGSQIRNTFIIFIVSGFWHGANWTFIVWGALNAIYFLPLLVLNKNRQNLDIVAKGKLLPSLREFGAMALTFFLTCLAWIFFRAESVGSAIDYIGRMITGVGTISDLKESLTFILTQVGSARVLILGLFFMMEWLGRENKYAIENLGLKWSKPVRWGFYYLVISIIALYGGKQQEFIYFQF